MSFLSLTTLDCAPGKAGVVASSVESHFMSPHTGRLLGCWSSEVGQLNQVLVLSQFESREELERGQGEVLSRESAIGRSADLVLLNQEGFTSFSGVPTLTGGSLGKFYEVRTYHLTDVPEALPQTIASWQDAVPARVILSPLVVVMAALDGAKRIVHIWPFNSIEERQAIRATSFQTGVWPPKGTLQWIKSAANALYVPAAFSPLT